MSHILDGKQVASEIEAQLHKEITRRNLALSLIIIQVGSRPESTAFINQKRKVGERLGIEVRYVQYDTLITTDGLVQEIKTFNTDPTVHGIIVQLPLPEHVEKEVVINAIDPRKDTDGLTAANLRSLMENQKTIVPATSRGILTMLNYYGISVAGKHVTVVGRSVLVGKSTALLLTNHDATITLCHSKTANLSEEVKRADIVVVAVGKQNFIGTSEVRPGQVIIDVGMNVLEEAGESGDDATPKKRKLTGDVDFNAVKDVVEAITPVPGGVGPMTVISLFQNLYDSYLEGQDTAVLP